MYGMESVQKNIYSEIDRCAADAPPGADSLAFIPYLSGTRTQPELKASFVGITRQHGYAHFARAILEGVVFELYYLYEKLERLCEKAGYNFSPQQLSAVLSAMIEEGNNSRRTPLANIIPKTPMISNPIIVELDTIKVRIATTAAINPKTRT